MTGHTAKSDIGDTARTASSRGVRRRLLVAATVAGAGALLAAAAAWACVLRDDVTLKVFNQTNYPSGTCASVGTPTGSACSKAIGNGAQTGLATVDIDGTVTMKIGGNGFIDATGDLSYSIHWRHPGSTSNCHQINPDGGVVMMGASATVTSGGTLDVTRSSISTAGRNPESGMVRICVQDYEFGGTGTSTPTPTVVIGQMVDISVMLDQSGAEEQFPDYVAKHGQHGSEFGIADSLDYAIRAIDVMNGVHGGFTCAPGPGDRQLFWDTANGATVIFQYGVIQNFYVVTGGYSHWETAATLCNRATVTPL